MKKYYKVMIYEQNPLQERLETVIRQWEEGKNVFNRSKVRVKTESSESVVKSELLITIEKLRVNALILLMDNILIVSSSDKINEFFMKQKYQNANIEGLYRDTHQIKNIDSTIPDKSSFNINMEFDQEQLRLVQEDNQCYDGQLLQQMSLVISSFKIVNDKLFLLKFK